MDGGVHILTIKGSRLPNRAERSEMLQQLWSLVESSKIDPVVILELTDDQILSQLASGRYGVLQERFELPDDADLESIAAQYERGILTVSISKKQYSFDRLFPQHRPQRIGYGVPSKFPFSGPEMRSPSVFDSMFW
mmetsp:Transcript_108813/g.188291  ORF Transcript_108813/g.188291 Transcript_108813/m.188291 type:complete len:136 (-) Transcript_108813:572-979(-)